MLNYCEEAVEFLADLECISSFCGWLASSFTANVKENGSGLIVPVLVIDPVPLCEVAFVKKVEMIELLCEIQCLKVF